jgi:hypothetical protein
MLILRGVASSEKPRGQLDDQAALEYARRLVEGHGIFTCVPDDPSTPGNDPMCLDRKNSRLFIDRPVFDPTS